MFNNFDLTDQDVLDILEEYDNLINRYSKVNGSFNEDLKQFIVMTIYEKLTKNREK